jgi:hypothetical protein
VVTHCGAEEALEVAGVAPAAAVVLLVAVVELGGLVAATEVVLLVAVLDAVVEVVLVVVVVVDAPVFDVVVEVFLAVVVLDTPVLGVVAVVFCVVVAGVVGVCVVSVCARRIAAETKLQIIMMIERFMFHPFKEIVEGKVSRLRRQFKNRARSHGIRRAMDLRILN